MPVRRLKGGAYRWGNKGKTYRGKDAHAKAVKQMQAAFANGYKGKK